MSSLVGSGLGIEKGGRWLLRHADVTFSSGEVTALVGPNGSGKTTFLRLLCGLWKPSEGQVTLNGRDLATYSAREVARQIALVRQTVALQHGFTVEEVVAMGRYPHTGRVGAMSDEDSAKVREAMEKTDTASLLGRPANQLSGGELQRVLLARCLATEASHILLDEPTSNLDLAHALDVLHLCRDLANEGKSVVIALHDLSAALRFADRGILVSDGKVLETGEIAEVLEPEKIRKVFGVRAEKIQAKDGSEGLLFFRKPSPACLGERHRDTRER